MPMLRQCQSLALLASWAARQQRAEAREREEGGGPSRLLERGVARLEQLFDTTGIRGNYVSV